MTTTKEETINKLSNLTWQRKLNIRPLVANEKEQIGNETPDRVLREEKPGGGVLGEKFTGTGGDKRSQRVDEKENLGCNNVNAPPPPPPIALNGRRRRLSVVNAAHGKNINSQNVRKHDDDNNVKAVIAKRNDDKPEPKPIGGTNYTVRQKLMRASKCLQLNRDESNVFCNVVPNTLISSTAVSAGIQFQQYPLNRAPNRKDYYGGDGGDGDSCTYEAASPTELALLNLVASHQNYMLPNENPVRDRYRYDENENQNVNVNEINSNHRSSYYNSCCPPPFIGEPRQSEHQQNHVVRYSTASSSCRGSYYSDNSATISCARFQSTEQELAENNGGEIPRLRDHYGGEAIARQSSLFNTPAPATLSRPVYSQSDSRRQISGSQNRNQGEYDVTLTGLHANSYSANLSPHPVYSETMEGRNDEYEGNHPRKNSSDIGFPSNVRPNTFVEYNSGGNNNGSDGGGRFPNFVVMPTNESRPACSVNETYGDRRNRDCDQTYCRKTTSDDEETHDNRLSYFNASNSYLTPAMQQINIHNVAKLLCNVNNINHATAATTVVTAPEAQGISQRAAGVNDIAFQHYDDQRLAFEPSDFRRLADERPSECRVPTTDFSIAENQNQTRTATNHAFYQKFNGFDENFISTTSPTITSSSSSSFSSKNSNRKLESGMLTTSSSIEEEPFDNRLSYQLMSAKSELKSQVCQSVGDEMSTVENGANNSYANATRPQPMTFRKNLIRRAKDDLCNDRIRFSRPRRDSMTINVKDDCFINFNQKAIENCVSFKSNAPPTVGILKKSAKWQSLPLSECSIRFTRSCADEGVDEVDVLPREIKKVSFSPHVYVTE